ncbi:MAG TPA: benzoyl-CoA 2,3-epoxidase subunit BoxB, partial [Hyphomicrobiales bacterium]|nr:benzoyl-CoA 2,3-epoxidase subunit BoxB [Hyphomicrobiales bacterium]
FELKLSHPAFHRYIGGFTNVYASPTGELMDKAAWEKRKGEWLPNTDDMDFIYHLMQPEYGIGKYANWISPPKVGIDNKPGDFEYVKLA